MINPSQRHSAKGTVTTLRRFNYKGDIDFTIQLDNGVSLESMGFVYHKTIKIGDRVSVICRFSIMSDRYGVISVRRSK